MTGVEVAQAGGARNIVLFNDRPGQVPPPITSTSYVLSGSPSPVSHTLLGVVPDSLYSVMLSNGVVHVDQSASGNTLSSPAGVLHFSNLVSVPSPLLTATKTVSGRFHPAEPVAYTIRLTNSGSAAAANTPADELQDTVPGSLAVSGADDGGAPGTVSVVGNVVRWNGSIPAASTVTVTIQATINGGTVGAVVANQGTINYDSDGNGSADATAPTDDPMLPGSTDPTSFTVTVPVEGDLVPGSERVFDLGAAPGPPDVDVFGFRQGPRSSYEVVVDGATGDVGSAGLGAALDLVAADGVTLLKPSTPATAGSSRSLRFENASAGPILDQIVRVTSSGCATGCTPEDQYRIRAWDTTLTLARFNNSASQVTILVLQNTTGATVTGNVWLWGPTGQSAGTTPFSLAPHRSFVLNTSTLAPGVGGTLTVSHDAPYGTLQGKAVALEASTGFTFDTPLRSRPR
jgi:hypothetical protein